MSLPEKSRTSSIGGWDRDHLVRLMAELEDILREMRALEEGCAPYGETISPNWHESVANLLHYLAMRRRDIRSLQEKLASLGLSSLGRAEKHVMASIVSVLRALSAMAGESSNLASASAIGFDRGKQLLEEHTEQLLGPKPGGRRTRIMVTMPSEAADDYLLVRDLLDAGMDCMRINCAHDNADAWGWMIDNLRRAKRELGKKCRILMDIGGPKLRTGPVESGNRVVKWRPRRDPFGRVLEPARIWLYPEENNESPDAIADATLPLPGTWLASLRAGDRLEFTDTRGSSRSLQIIGEVGGCRWAETTRTAYVTTGTTLVRHRDGAPQASAGGSAVRIGEITPQDPHILLKKGDLLVLTRNPIPGREALCDARGRVVQPATVSCSLPEIFDFVRAGERIWLDDGKIGGIVRTAGHDQIRVEITHARPQGEKLRGEKGINLPDTRLGLSGITGQDEKDLAFIARHAHMVGVSFVQSVEDVQRVREILRELNAEQRGIVLKIETRRGFEMLPDILIAAMGSQNVGVMIARGDLAVECGYERLAEVQEEILWLCEAAHIPVIWATQVLETLAKSGLPSRAEITDAAMGERAECVMLNKGPHIIEAMRVLDNILQRMEAHMDKKSHMMRQLRWWEQAHTHCQPPRPD